MLSSRLDRLLTLLCSSSEATRVLAARQIGLIALTRSSQIPALLALLHPLLRNSRWETRAAAVDAVEQVCGSAEGVVNLKSEMDVNGDGDECLNLSFASFDLDKVLDDQNVLEASRTSKFSAAAKPDLEQQRQELSRKLGLEVVEGKGGSLLTEEDLQESTSTPSSPSSSSSSGASARKRNRAKRTLAKANKESQRKRLKATMAEEAGPTYKAPPIKPDNVQSDDVFACLKDFCDCLLRDLVHPTWEIRHGAATALQAVIRLHGEKLGSRRWLESVATQLLQVLCRDRVNDFVSDHVVAPVRESAAQAFVATLVLLDADKVAEVSPILVKLLLQKDWQCKHGALLAMKYLLAVNGSCVSSLCGPIFECMQMAEEEDVVAVAAQALLPVVSNLFDCDQISTSKLMDHLWNVLQSLDELANSTHAVMSLLSEVLSHQASRDAGVLASGNMAERVPRLLPYLSHPSTLTRKAALNTLETITSQMAIAEHFLPYVAKPICCHLFQRALLEHNAENLVLIEKIWNYVCDFTPLGPLLLACCPLYGSWVTMIAQPPSFPIPPHLLICPRSSSAQPSPQYLGGPGTQHLGNNLFEKDRVMTKARCLAARMLGKLAGFIVQPVPGMDYSKDQLTPMEMFVQKILLPNLTPKSAYQRSSISLVIVEWCHQHDVKDVPQTLHQTLFQMLTEQQEQGFDENLQSIAMFQSEATDFISTLKHYKLGLPEDMLQQELSTVLTFERTRNFIQKMDLTALLSTSKVKNKLECSLKERREGLVNSLNQITKEQAFLNTMTMANVAGAVVALGAKNFCGKLNPVLKPLMEAIKREQNEELQTRAAVSLADLMVSCSSLTPLAAQKVIKNLVSFACVDTNITPVFDPEANSENNSRIQMLKLGQVNISKSNDGQEFLSESIYSPATTQERYANFQSRGATIALKTLITRFPLKPFEQLPTLEEMTIGAVKNAQERSPADLVYCLRALEIIVPCLPTSIHSTLGSILQPLSDLLRCVYSSIRHMSSRCVAQLAQILPVETMSHVVMNIVPQLLESSFVQVRQGGIECLACIVQCLDLDVVPYIVFLLIPVMARMSDVNEQVRLLATNVFATFIKLVPLDGAVDLPQNLPQELKAMREKERQFLDQLLRGGKLEDVHLPFQISVKLRDYQKEGISWLSFLRKYKLHGILCDDMGLGKTLQTICILALHHKEIQAKRVTEFPSIVVCPQTLCNHWYNEIMAHIDGENSRFLRPLVYAGSTQTRSEIRQQFHAHNLLISSYEVIRNDCELLSSQQWNYVVLDEGHIIKNGRTKTTQAIKKLRANYRLVLTGTPIQNTVLELWSIFDFLMPGYLGTERDFNARFARPIANSRDPKCTGRAKERGALAMEALHKQVLPFILRRIKDDVLKDLPEKITQDYYCDLSAVQVKLYDDYTSKRQEEEQQHKDGEMNGESKGGSKAHIFKALQYLRKVCNHPKLVVDKDHPEYPNVMKFLRASNSSLDDISHAAKLPALRDLLLQCGIGASYNDAASAIDGGDAAPVVQHRALIFCQLKSMIDIVETDLLKNRMPNVTYLRLDGSVAPALRQGIVDKFNNDSSIDVLLLSTAVGGLGLNLTGADTVIFVEHDWNPMKDLQAMDRAHRLGQKRAVNVYRLITRNTIEEKIMSLQWFKLKTANTVISDENASLQSMGTEKVFDLFALDDDKNTTAQNKQRNKLSKRQGLQAIVDELPELWDDSQYRDEYDVDKFVRKHNSNATATHSKSDSQ